VTVSPSALCLLTLEEAADLVRRAELSPSELIESTLERIERLDPVVNSYLSVAGDAARLRAELLTATLAAGTYLGPLHGIPVSAKDNIATVDLPTTAGSRTLLGATPPESARVIDLLEAAGAVVIGKCNLFEFAYGAHRLAEARNPWNVDYACGGSSSGSAAAVAAYLCQGSIGTDTGGSIRIPASFCGVVGLKPTYGVVSRTGIIPVSWNLDHVGPMARTVTDATLMLEAMVDPLLDPPPRYEKSWRQLRSEVDRDISGI